MLELSLVLANADGGQISVPWLVIGIAILALGVLFLIKKVLTGLVTVLMVLLGAAVVVVAIFAVPLGLVGCSSPPVEEAAADGPQTAPGRALAAAEQLALDAEQDAAIQAALTKYQDLEIALPMVAASLFDQWQSGNRTRQSREALLVVIDSIDEQLEGQLTAP